MAYLDQLSDEEQQQVLDQAAKLNKNAPEGEEVDPEELARQKVEAKDSNAQALGEWRGVGRSVGRGAAAVGSAASSAAGSLADAVKSGAKKLESASQDQPGAPVGDLRRQDEANAESMRTAGPGGLPLAAAGQEPAQAPPTVAGAVKQASQDSDHPPPAAGAAAGQNVAPGKPTTVADATKRAAKPQSPAGASVGELRQQDEAALAANPEKTLQDLSKQASSTSPDYQKQLGKLDSLKDSYMQAYRETTDRIQKQELAERMGHALAQLGAGIQGQRTGLDTVSGLKFDKTDWSARYKNALDELKAQLDDLREQRGAATELERTNKTEAGANQREATHEAGENTRAQERNETETKNTETRGKYELASAKERGEATVRGAEVRGQTARDVTAMKGSNSLAVAAQRAQSKGGAQKDDPGAIALDNLQAASQLIEQGDAKGKGTAQWNANYGRAKEYLRRTGGDTSILDTALQQSKDAAKTFSSTAEGTGAKTLEGAARPAAGGAPRAPAAGGMVKMRDPTSGEVRLVKPDAVEKYKKLGAEVVQ